MCATGHKINFSEYQHFFQFFFLFHPLKWIDQTICTNRQRWRELNRIKKKKYSIFVTMSVNTNEVELPNK